jgi:20S proteasome subunit beta 4
MSDSLIGLVGEDYVLIAADTAMARSIVLLKGDQDKIMDIESNKLLAASGSQGDRDQFCSYIEKNINLYTLRTGVPLTTHAAANFTRSELADALRKNPYSVNLLLGGIDADGTPSLYFIDYLASMGKMDYAMAGYAGYFLYSFMDKYYKKGLKLDEGLKLLQGAIHELNTRLVLNSVNFTIKVLDKNGVRIIQNPSGVRDTNANK